MAEDPATQVRDVQDIRWETRRKDLLGQTTVLAGSRKLARVRAAGFLRCEPGDIEIRPEGDQDWL